MDPEINRRFFSNPKVALEYARAATSVGLWKSERDLVQFFVPKTASILELGAGAGRVSLGLAKLGYKNLTVTDFAEPMVEIAKEVLADVPAGTHVNFAVEDATNLSFADNTFDAAIFAFNGLQMIPKRERRERALQEISRILKPRGILIFCGHDQKNPSRKEYWDQERARWLAGTQQATLDDFGDYHHFTEQGEMFIHAARPADMFAALNVANFQVLETKMRSEIAQESPAVLEFSDDTRFWVAKKKA